MSKPSAGRPEFFSRAMGLTALALVVWIGGLALAGQWHEDGLWIIGVGGVLSLVVTLLVLPARPLHADVLQRYERIVSVLFPVIVLGGWEFLSRSNIMPSGPMPPPTTIVREVWNQITVYDDVGEASLIGRPWLIPGHIADGNWSDAWTMLKEGHLERSLYRVVAGFFFGAIPGVLVGAAMGLNRTVRSTLDGSISAAYVIPKLMIFPLLTLILPSPFGEFPKVTVVAVSTFFIVVVNTTAGVREIDSVLIDAGRNFGAKRFQLFRNVIAPASARVVFAGFRLAIGTALIVTVAIEWVRASNGLGFVVRQSFQGGRLSVMWVGLVSIAALGVFLQWIFARTERRVLSWNEL